MALPADAFAPELVHATDRWLADHARRLAAHPGDADDVRQDAWLALLERARQDLERPRAWLARVASNGIRKRHRDRLRIRRREHGASRREGVLDPPEAALERTELRAKVLDAVLELPQPYRSTVALHFFSGKSLPEIARLEAVPVSTVKTRLSRGLERLRRPLRRVWSEALSSPALPWPLLAKGRLARRITSAPRTAAAPWQPAGALIMSTKTVASAACASIVVAIGIGFAVREALPGSSARGDAGAATAASAAAAVDGRVDAPAGDAGGTDRAAAAAGTLSRESAVQAAAGGEGAAAGAGVIASASADDAKGSSASPATGAAPSEDALAARKAFADLKRSFGDGGRTGWRQVGFDIAAMQALVLATDESFEEFLALLDGETDASFLEALLHHLPQAGGESRAAIVADEQLREEIWKRYEDAAEPERRLAFLRFFAFHRELSGSRMGHFVALATTDRDSSVRQLAIDAIASNRDLISETWETLVRVYESDTDAACRETAMQGLSLADAEPARRMVRDAFTSADEALRAAAIGSAAGEDLPEDLTGGDAAAYLLDELRAASTPRYKMALVKRLVPLAPGALREELERALPAEQDWTVKKGYREALEQLADSGVAARPRN